MVSVLGSFNFSNVWDFSHQISSVSYYINERPLFWSNFEIITPNTLEAAMLKRSPQAPKIYMLGDFIIPSSKQARDVILEMRDISKSILTQILVGMVYILINKIFLKRKTLERVN